LKETKVKLKGRKRLGNPNTKIFVNMEKVAAFNMNSILERTEEVDSLENENNVNEREKSKEYTTKISSKKFA